MVYYLGIATLIFMGYFTSKNSDKYLNFMLCILFMFIALHNPYLTGTDGRSYRHISKHIFQLYLIFLSTIIHMKLDMLY